MCSERNVISPDLPEQSSVPRPGRAPSCGAPSQAEVGRPRPRALPGRSLPGGRLLPAVPREYLAAAAAGGQGAALCGVTRRGGRAGGWESGQVTPGGLRPFSSSVGGRGSRARCEELRARAAARRRPLLPRPGTWAPLVAGECGAPSRWAGAKLFRGAEEKRWGEGERRRGAGVGSSPVQRTWARRAGSGIRVPETREPGQALPGLWRALRKLSPRRLRVPRVEALPAGGRGRRAHLRPPWESTAAPSIPKGRWSPPPLGFEPLPSAPAGQGPAVPGGRTKVLAGGTGRERDLLDLDLRGHFPSSWIWARSPTPPTPPRIPEPLSFCFFPSGALLCPRGRNELGALLLQRALPLWLPELHPVPAAAAG